MGPNEEYQDGYMDGRFSQPAESDRGDNYDEGYIQGSSDYLDIIEERNGVA